jgi:hypothetical protein
MATFFSICENMGKCCGIVVFSPAARLGDDVSPMKVSKIGFGYLLEYGPSGDVKK